MLMRGFFFQILFYRTTPGALRVTGICKKAEVSGSGMV